MRKQKENIMGTVIICGAVAVLMVILVFYTVKHWKKQKNVRRLTDIFCCVTCGAQRTRSQYIVFE